MTRRTLLHTALAAPAAAQSSGTTLAYIGAYSDRGKGIHIFTVDPSTGALRPRNVVTLESPASLYFHPNGRTLYAGNAISEFRGARDGSVTALAVDPATGNLTVRNAISSGGAGPAHISVHPNGRLLFSANYAAGTVGVLSIEEDGSLGKVTHSVKIEGPLGKQPAVDAPPGSFAISGHDAPHTHMAHTDPTGRFLLVTDLGTDRTYIFRIDVAAGQLTPHEQPYIQAANGAGPRHFVFHPDRRTLFVLNEEASTLDVVEWDAEHGGGKIRQTVSTLPAGFEGTSYTSEITISPDGRFVYCANRQYDTVAVFAFDKAKGTVRLRDLVWTHGSYPRNFLADPSGRFLYVLHTRSDNVTVFRIDPRMGGLRFTGHFAAVGNPSEIRFLRLAG